MDTADQVSTEMLFVVSTNLLDYVGGRRIPVYHDRTDLNTTVVDTFAPWYFRYVTFSFDVRC